MTLILHNIYLSVIDSLSRFGGQEFPPMIFFKIFIHTEGKGVKYLSGKRVIKPASEVSKTSRIIRV